MSQKFQDLPFAKQQEIISDMNNLIVEHGLEDYLRSEHKIREICDFMCGQFSHFGSLEIKGSVPLSKKDAVKEFNENARTILQDNDGAHCLPSVRVFPGEHHQYIPDVVPLDNSESEPVELVHTDGQVWLVFIWNPLEPSCETYLDKLEEILTKNGDEWGSNVRITAISFDHDSEKESAVSFVESKGYSKIEFYHDPNFTAQFLYIHDGDVRPKGIFINKEGKVEQMGHPQERDFDKDFSDLLSGQALTSHGVAALPFEFPTHFKKLETDTVVAEMAAFLELANELKANDIIRENIDDIEGLIKLVCTLSLTTIYDPKTKESMSHYVCEKILSGEPHRVKAVLAVLEEKLKGSFEEKLTLEEKEF